MQHSVRAAAVIASAMFLLAAGKAPSGLKFKPKATVAQVASMLSQNDHGVLAAANAARISLQMTPDTIVPVDDIERPQIDPPELGPILPESDTLHGMVTGIRDMPKEPINEDMRCLATTIYYESKGEPLRGQLAVAQVVLNRVEAGRFGRNVCEVVTAPKQFSFVRGGQLPTPRKGPEWETARAIAVIATSDAWQDVVGGAKYFHATHVRPGWRLERVASIGNHIFYR